MTDNSTTGKKLHARDAIDLTGDDSDVCEAPKRPRTAAKTSSNNVCLLPPALAVVEAAASGQRQELEGLLRTFDEDLTAATVAAASHGHFGCVVTLRDNFCDPDDDELHLSVEGHEAMRDAAGPAARNGHADIVEFMLSAMMSDGEVDESACWDAFHEGASSGHAEVVKVAADFVPTYTDNFEEEFNTALSNAIEGGHADVVAFLLSWEECKSDVAAVFEEAVSKDQDAVAERIYEVYANVEQENLLVHMAGLGRLDAVKYMCEHGHIDSKLLCKALQSAIDGKCLDVGAYLEAIQRVEPEPAP